MAHKKMYLVSLFSVSVMVIVSVYGSKKQNKTKQTKKKPKIKPNKTKQTKKKTQNENSPRILSKYKHK